MRNIQEDRKMQASNITEAKSHYSSPVENGLPDEAISKVHKSTNDRLLKCATAFLRRVAN